MSDVDAWDADDFEPELPSGKTPNDKWDGEDADDDVKDSWEDEEEGEKKPATEGSQAFQRPKKKPLAERIAEKEALKEQEKIKEKEEKRELTADEKLTEKIRLKQVQEQDSLNLAKGLFGVQEATLDKMFPATQAEFTHFADALKSKITFFEESQHYQAFLSKFISDLSIGLGVEEVKKLSVGINSLYHEKDRQKKELDKKKKKKSKATIKVDRADDLDLMGDAAGGGGYDDDDDFI